MKKLQLIAVSLFLVACLSACDKDKLGVYEPKFKISQIYSEVDNHYLKEKWYWQLDNLGKIEYYRKNGSLDYTQTYFYDKNRLVRIESGEQYSEFLYDGNWLTTINTYDGSRLIETYTLSYDHEKLSHIDISVKGEHKGANSLLDCFVPGSEMLKADIHFSDSKRERYDFSAASIDYIWEGDNVGYMKMRLTRPDSIQKLTFSYVYDKNINPMNGFLLLNLDHQILNDQPQYVFCSKNNVVSVMVTEEYDIFSHTDSYTYSYDYYKKYPTKVYSTFMGVDNHTGMYKLDSLLLYTYLYQ